MTLRVSGYNPTRGLELCCSGLQLGRLCPAIIHTTHVKNSAAIQSTVPAANVSVRKSAHNTNISKPLGWRIFASHWVVLLLLATEKGPSPASSQGKR